MTDARQSNLKDPRTLFRLWLELTGEDMLSEEEKKPKKGEGN